MRKLLVAFIVPALAVTFGSMAAQAQSQLNLDPDAGTLNNITFTVSGPNTASMTVGTCGFGAVIPTSTCWSGNAVGIGTFLPLTSPIWIMDFTGVSVAISETSPGVFSLSQTGNINFLDDGILAGTLQLASYSEAPGTGIFDSALTANLTITGGAGAGLFPGLSGAAKVVIDFTSTNDLGTLFGSGGSTLAANFSSTEIFPTATPEPSSLLLLGSGLLGVGSFVRRRIFGA